MQLLSLPVEVVGPTEAKEMDGLSFTSCAFIRVEVDGMDLLSESEFEGTVLYFPELERSASNSGQYLIFTCACGVAEDAGWAEIEVLHSERSVSWVFDHAAHFAFEFEARQYGEAIRLCRDQILKLSEGTKLVPQYVVFPLERRS